MIVKKFLPERNLVLIFMQFCFCYNDAFISALEWHLECRRNSTHHLCSAFLFITLRLDPGKERLIPCEAHTLQFNYFTFFTYPPQLNCKHVHLC